jgi:hypothetical protein
MQDGVLNLSVVDVYGDTVQEPVDVFLRHQSLAHDPVFRNIKPARTITINDLHRSPQGLYRIEIDAPSYLAVSRFINIPSSGPVKLVVPLPVNKDRVVSVTFPAFTALATDAQRLLSASTLGSASGAALYEAFDNIRKAGFLNLVAKSARTRLLSDKPVLSYLNRITDQRGDRFFAMASADLHAEVVHSVTGGIFSPVSDVLHDPAPGFKLVDSYKTPDHYGNLQVTFATNGTDWSVDVDIDDAQGFEHIFQVVRNAVTGKPTHPYDIHEILVEFQELDPGYYFNLGAPATTRLAEPQG